MFARRPHVMAFIFLVASAIALPASSLTFEVVSLDSEVTAEAIVSIEPSADNPDVRILRITDGQHERTLQAVRVDIDVPPMSRRLSATQTLAYVSSTPSPDSESQIHVISDALFDFTFNQRALCECNAAFGKDLPLFPSVASATTGTATSPPQWLMRIVGVGTYAS